MRPERETLPLTSTLHLAGPTRGHQSGAGERVGPLLLVIAALLAIVIFLPAEGRLTVPVQTTIDHLLGRAAFVLPLGCALIGALCVARTLRPDFSVPTRRLVGVTLLLVATLIAQHFLGGQGGSGAVGDWLSSVAVDTLGIVLTAVLVVLMLGGGIVLAFDLRLRVPKHAPSAEQVQQEADATS